MSNNKYPKCLGHYDVGDDDCDGDPKAEEDHNIQPCTSRDRCASLRQHCTATGRSPGDYVKLKKMKDRDGEKRTYASPKGDAEVFSESLAKWADRWGVTNGRVTLKEPKRSKKKGKTKKATTKSARPVKPPAAATRKKGSAATASKAEGSLKEAYELVSRFTTALAENTERAFAERPTAAEPGDLFLVDRLPGSRYASVYCAAPGGKKVAVAIVLPHTNHGTCQIRVAAEPDDFKKSHASKLEIVSIKDGRFKSRTKRLDKEGLAIAAEAIAALVKGGTISLPPTV